MNADCVWGVEVEKQAPFADAEPIQSLTISQLFNIAFACLTVVRECKEDAHRDLAIDPA